MSASSYIFLPQPNCINILKTNNQHLYKYDYKIDSLTISTAYRADL
ncbi:hypothetical protein HMPREF1570_3195 [Klebsiella oxytoca KA-2]|nr:hypothetical protein HMPREF1570_3195 [Klebsiella oxytoca KA-2]